MNSPLDADAVLRDDVLLDALGRGELPEEFAGDPTARLLLAWCEDLHEPAPVRSPLPSARVLWLSRRVTVAAAIGVFAAGSLGSIAAASIAEPGDALWPITKVVYTERAQSIEARDEAFLTLRRARDAAAQHKPDQARKLCDEARHKAGDVRESDDRAAITDQVAQVLAALPRRPAAPTASETSHVPAPPRPKQSPAPEPSPQGEPGPAASAPAGSDPSASPSVQPSPDLGAPSPLGSPPPAAEPVAGS